MVGAAALVGTGELQTDVKNVGGEVGGVGPDNFAFEHPAVDSASGVPSLHDSFVINEPVNDDEHETESESDDGLPRTPVPCVPLDTSADGVEPIFQYPSPLPVDENNVFDLDALHIEEAVSDAVLLEAIDSLGETLELDDLPIPHPWPTSVPTHTDHLGFDVEPEILIPPFQLGLEPNQDPVLTQTAPRGVQSSQKNRRELSKKAKGKQPAKRSIVNVDPEPDEDDARAAESRRRGKMRARVPPSVLNELESARGSRVEDDHRRRAHGESTFDSRLPRAAAYTQLVVPDASIYPIVPAVSPQHKSPRSYAIEVQKKMCRGIPHSRMPEMEGSRSEDGWNDAQTKYPRFSEPTSNGLPHVKNVRKTYTCALCAQECNDPQGQWNRRDLCCDPDIGAICQTCWICYTNFTEKIKLEPGYAYFVIMGPCIKNLETVEDIDYFSGLLTDSLRSSFSAYHCRVRRGGGQAEKSIRNSLITQYFWSDFLGRGGGKSRACFCGKEIIGNSGWSPECKKCWDKLFPLPKSKSSAFFRFQLEMQQLANEVCQKMINRLDSKCAEGVYRDWAPEIAQELRDKLRDEKLVKKLANAKENANS